MQTRNLFRSRATVPALALLATTIGAAGPAPAAEPRGGEGPTAAILVSSDGTGSDTVRISRTADGQLFVRFHGTQSAMLLVEFTAGRAFAEAVTAYVQKTRSACSAEDGEDGLPRLTAPRAHRTGVDGVAVRCDAAKPGSYSVLLTRPRSDSRPLEPLSVSMSASALQAFAKDLTLLCTAARR